MARIELRFVHSYVAKGRTYTYFRRKGFPRVRLPDPSSPQFVVEYERLLRQSDAAPTFTGPGTLGALVKAYRASPEFTQEIGESSRRAYNRYLTLLDPYADIQADQMTRAWVLEERDRMADRPRTANYFVATISRLYEFGIDRGMVTENPASRPKKLKTGGKYRAWADNECALFENSDPPLMVLRAYMLAVHTGQRQGDILALPVRAYDGCDITLTQSKTMDDSERIVIPVRRVLREFLDAQAWKGLLMIHMDDKARSRMSPDYFRHAFRKHMRSIGLDQLHFHGLRHTMGKRLAEADGNVASILGHKTEAMARHYSSEARQVRLARTSIDKMDNEQ